MIAFPPALPQPQGWPRVVAQSIEQSFVAPGVFRAEIRLLTAAGPVVAHVVAVDPKEPSVRLGAVLAREHLVSNGETISAMAARTNAVAGVNADYFDIGNTNQPLNILVRGGALLRSPSKRIALFIGSDNSVHFASASLAGEVRYGSTRIPLTGVNTWPPDGGAALLTPDYGALGVSRNVTAIALGSPVAADGVTTYQVTGEGAAQPGPVVQTMLGFGPAASALASPPLVGTSVDVTLALSPPLSGIRAAVGGGPLLLADGAAVTDPNEPAPEERNVRFPLAGAGTTPGGELLLVAVDGRAQSNSIGLTRPEFAALFASLGVADAMAFDSGGSATLVGRKLGDDGATVLNVPSDGAERPVADGLFVYSDAPHGLAPHLAVRPLAAQALGGATIPLVAAVVDSSGHRLRGATVAPLVAAKASGTHTVRVSDGVYATNVTYETVDGFASLALAPAVANPDSGAAVTLAARGYDRLGQPVALTRVAWSARGGSIVADAASATFHAGTRNGTVTASVAGHTQDAPMLIGRHEQAVALFSTASAQRWQFATVPAGAAGVIAVSPSGELQLPYDLAAARADYANLHFALPGEPISFAVETQGDRSGVGLRAAFVNRFGERRALTLAKRVDWSGWRTLRIPLPSDLNPPVSLVSLYVVRLGETPLRTSGTIAFRNASVTLPGTP